MEKQDPGTDKLTSEDFPVLSTFSAFAGAAVDYCIYPTNIPFWIQFTYDSIYHVIYVIISAVSILIDACLTLSHLAFGSLKKSITYMAGA